MTSAWRGKTLAVLVLLITGSALGGAPLKQPTKQEILDAIRKASSEDFEAINIAADKRFGDVIELQSVEIIRFGSWNEKEAHWPVELCVTGTAQGSYGILPRPAGSNFPIRPFRAKARYQMRGDDFGGWQAKEVAPPFGKTTQAEVTCSTSPTRGDSAAAPAAVRGTQHAATSPSQDHGVDLDRYCRAKGHQRAENVDNTGYGWKCMPGAAPINVQEACVQQYGRNFVASLASAPPGRPSDWRCKER